MNDDVKEVIPGVEYHVSNYGDTEGHQVIKFVTKESDQFSEGTTGEALFTVLVERYMALNKISFCPENQFIIDLMKMARRAMSKRMQRKRLKDFNFPYDYFIKELSTLSDKILEEKQKDNFYRLSYDRKKGKYSSQ